MTITKKKKLTTLEKWIGERDPNFQRPAPVKVLRQQVAPHPQTLNNGQPRPRKRISKTK